MVDDYNINEYDAENNNNINIRNKIVENRFTNDTPILNTNSFRTKRKENIQINNNPTKRLELNDIVQYIPKKDLMKDPEYIIISDSSIDSSDDDTFISDIMNDERNVLSEDFTNNNINSIIYKSKPLDTVPDVIRKSSESIKKKLKNNKNTIMNDNLDKLKTNKVKKQKKLEKISEKDRYWPSNDVYHNKILSLNIFKDENQTKEYLPFSNFKNVASYIKILKSYIIEESYSSLKASLLNESHHKKQSKLVSMTLGNNNDNNSNNNNKKKDTIRILTFEIINKNEISTSSFYSSDAIMIEFNTNEKILGIIISGYNVSNSLYELNKVNNQSIHLKDTSNKQSELIHVLIDLKNLNDLQNTNIFEDVLNNKIKNNFMITNLMNLATLSREYQGVCSFKYISNDIRKPITYGNLNNTNEYNKNILKNINNSNHIKYLLKDDGYNSSQLDAIINVTNTYSKDKFFLIQGPPGTGKTTVIIGILKVLLSDYNNNNTTNQLNKNESCSTPIKIPDPFLLEKELYPLSYINKLKSDTNKPIISNSILNHNTINNKRILIVANSNTAIDEVLLRILQCEYNDKNNLIKRINKEGTNNIIRICSTYESSSMDRNKTLRNITLDTIIERKIKEKNKISSRKNKLFNDNNIYNKNDVKDIRRSIIKNSKIICSTLSSAASYFMCEFIQLFDTIIIDEAAQATDGSLLIPLRFRPNRIILIGDHKQLPPSITSKKLIQLGYNKSFFERLAEKNPNLINLLQCQYRMLPDICSFPNRIFYNNKLTTNKFIYNKNYRKYHDHLLFRPYLFYDVHNANEIKNNSTIYTNSYSNISEITRIIDLLYLLYKNYHKIIQLKYKIGIITPYRDQIIEIKNNIKLFENNINNKLYIDVNTIDAFQGKEKEIIIFSCVRANNNNNNNNNNNTIGFLSDIRRLNVAITRAKSSLWIFGHSNTLQNNDIWNKLIIDAKERNLYINDYDIDNIANESFMRFD